MKITAKYLVVPINMEAEDSSFVFYDTKGNWVIDFNAPFDAAHPQFYMYYDMEPFRGLELSLVAEPEIPCELSMTEERPMEGVYDSYLRPTVHFTAAYGWINDPNGLVYHDGVYHLYFQHNPLAPKWGNMHWGHATSRDLIHWREEELALYPDEMGTMFSGSGIRDERNASGLSPDGNTLMFYYTAESGGTIPSRGKRAYSQCLAISTDGGMTLKKYEGNPVVPWIKGSNRDPKVVWCEEIGCYLMALYIDFVTPEDTIDWEFRLLASDNLISWEPLQNILGCGGTECPDIFPLIADNGERKWIYTNGTDVYLVGHMDPVSRQFVADQAEKRGHWGSHSYAAQTYSGSPGRIIRIAWNRFKTEGTVFCGQMGIPMELSLVYVNEEYFIKAEPVREFDALIKGNVTAKEKAELSKTSAHDITIRAPKESEAFTIALFGCVFEVKPKENLFVFNEYREHPMPLSITGNAIEIRIITDTISIECYLDGGLIYANFGKVLDKNLNDMTVTCPEAEIIVKELNSIHR